MVSDSRHGTDQLLLELLFADDDRDVRKLRNREKDGLIGIRVEAPSLLGVCVSVWRNQGYVPKPVEKPKSKSMSEEQPAAKAMI